MYKKFSMIKIYIQVVSVLLMLLLIIFVYRYKISILFSVLGRELQLYKKQHILLINIYYIYNNVLSYAIIFKVVYYLSFKKYKNIIHLNIKYN